MKTTFLISFISLSVLFLTSCKDDKPQDDIDDGDVDCSTMTLDASTNVKGYNILAKVPGIWNGAVYSPTPLGSYPEWIVDFRPISASQVSAKNELDAINDIFMSFFVAKFENKYMLF